MARLNENNKKKHHKNFFQSIGLTGLPEIKQDNNLKTSQK